MCIPAPEWLLLPESAGFGSTQTFLLLAMALPAGKLLDMGHFRQATLFRSVLYVFSLFMVSIVHTDQYYQIFLAQGLGMGIGAGFLYVPAIAVQARHWKDRKGLAMDIVTAGSIFFAIMLNQLFEKPSVGFAWGVRASDFVVLGLLIFANLLMSDRIVRLDDPDIAAKEKPKAIPDIKGIMTDLPYLLVILVCLFINLGLFFPYLYLQLFAVLHDIDNHITFYFYPHRNTNQIQLAILSAASLPGRLLPNILADRIGPFFQRYHSYYRYRWSAQFRDVWNRVRVGGIAAFAGFYGFFSGGFLSLCPACLAALSRTPDEVGHSRTDQLLSSFLSSFLPSSTPFHSLPNTHRVRFGIAYFLAGFGILFGHPINGRLLGGLHSSSNNTADNIHSGVDLEWSKAIIFSGVTVFSVAGVRAMAPLALNRTRTGPEVQVQWLCKTEPGPPGPGRGPEAEEEG
ncbi:hypothetical protein D9758_009778 [Tetrapyrgos nigripes]|uniref:MFS general substrate transporter n=1 Tax=Tetrapyrgos nigripes TaxID=182062 RepID=A0A8H5GK16_9AGAR|nr:hypothetical protein D9758_009778 [Tetrapyrgos nigripes]